VINQQPITHHIHFVRHGDVAVNTDICYGQLDCDVADSFQQELVKLNHFIHQKDWFSEKQIQQATIISSPLRRCLRLAKGLEASLNMDFELKTEAGFKEINFGDWEGLSWETIGRNNIEKWNDNLLEYRFPHGESASEFDQRVITAWQQLLQTLNQSTKSKVIIVVTHAGVIRSILSHFLHIPLAQSLSLNIDKLSISSIRYLPEHPSLSRCLGVNLTL